ncbi:MAG TPA: hypothetical protein VEI07_18640 [Planctomycetaceae bacterium]|nr:hypothetical protein [Planctomycetaceae bacterium]
MANLFVGNDNDVYLQGYVLAATGAAVTDALPAFTVYFNVGTENDPVQGSAISGLSAISMSFVAGTNGDYRGKIPGNSGLSVGSQYFIVVTFANYLDSFQAWFQAVYRTGS